MDENNRDFPDSEWEARVEAAYRRMQQGLPPVAWLPPVCDLVGLRREVRRLRAGLIRPADPRMSARALADTLEQGIVMNLLELREQKQQDDEAAAREAERYQEVLDYNRWWMDVYRALKRLPEANDPNSEIAVQIVTMKREIRKLRGRRWRKRRGASRSSPRKS